MEFTVTNFTFGERPAVTLPDKAFLNYLGEAGVRKMVNDHYELLRESSIAPMFPRNNTGFEAAKKHSADFFVQILGGPAFYNNSRGKPKLAARHGVLSITQADRLVWLNCYAQVLSKLNIPDELLHSFWQYLNVFSHWMVNKE